MVSSLIRHQSTWIEIRIIRDWAAKSLPLLRITANSPWAKTGTLKISIDGESADSLSIEQLRESHGKQPMPLGFRPIGGEGYWYPVGAATSTMIDAMIKGLDMQVTVPLETTVQTMDIDLRGIHAALTWLDTQQARQDTTTAIVLRGPNEPHDAPHADLVTSPDVLPPAVKTAWENNRFCADIDPAIFGSLDGISSSLGQDSKLFLLPCGTPTAYNTAYVAFRARAGDNIQQLQFARMSDHGPIATDTVYNARWNPVKLELRATFKGTGTGDCGIWDRWQWTGATFALTEEATKSTCDGKDTNLDDWPRTWPIPR